MNDTGGYRRNSKKKFDIKPTVSINIKAAIYRVSDITKAPVKDVAEYITALVIRDRKAIEHLRPYFKRNYHFDKHSIYFGDISNQSVVKRNNEEPGERITIRFKQEDYAIISNLSHALDCTKSRTVAVCLEIGILNIRYVNTYIKNYLRKELTEWQMQELHILMRELRENKGVHHTWAAILSYVDSTVGPKPNIKETVNDFLINHWRDQN
ncbi:MAG: hypothetical protein KBT36_11195 [Kurthia sp.]|nr:hypothetical protein [Candidatus Kurthia equi]